MALFCQLCKKNGESVEYYQSHKLKDENNNVECPVLKQYTCPKCREVGKHTVSYCPRGKKSIKESREKAQKEQWAVINQQQAVEKEKRQAANKSRQSNPRKGTTGLRKRNQNCNGQLPQEKQVKTYDDGKKLARAIKPIASMKLGIEENMKLMSLVDPKLPLHTLRTAHILLLMTCNPDRLELVKAVALLAHDIINSLY